MNTWIFVIIIVIVNAIFMTSIATTDDDDLSDQLLIGQIISVSIVISLQLFYGYRSFNRCQNCGHRRNQHDKEQLAKKGHSRITSVICDNFVKATYKVPENLEDKYQRYDKDISRVDNGL
jgi:hypothetical protein